MNRLSPIDSAPLAAPALPEPPPGVAMVSPSADASETAPLPQKSADSLSGVLYALAAYGAWAAAPLYFKAVKDASALEVLSHRIIWGLPLLAILITIARRWGDVVRALRSRRTLRCLAVTTILIGANWYVFIIAVAQGHMLQASLGYYINPLLSVGLGVVFMKERLSRAGVAGIILAAIGVTYLAIRTGGFPWIALFLAFSFGFYGLLRKRASVEALAGLTIEMAFLAPAAVMYFAWLLQSDRSGFLHGPESFRWLLPLAGVVTTIPMLWFTAAARRVRLSTLGFLQYIAPTGQFLLATLLFGEHFTQAHAVAFACIWTALAIYSVDAALAARRARKARAIA